MILFSLGRAGTRGGEPTTTPSRGPKKKTSSVLGAGEVGEQRVSRSGGVTEVQVVGRKPVGSSTATATAAAASQPPLRSKKSVLSVVLPARQEVKKSYPKGKVDVAGAGLVGLTELVAAVAGKVSVGVLVYDKLTDGFV